jgi:importin subunit beta-1
MFDYVVSLREGIMDAWGGIIGAMKTGEKSISLFPHDGPAANMLIATALQPYVESIFQLLNIVWLDGNRSDALMRSSMGVIGYGLLFKYLEIF